MHCSELNSDLKHLLKHMLRGGGGGGGANLSKIKPTLNENFKKW